MTKEEYLKTIDNALQVMCDTANNLPFDERICWWTTLRNISIDKLCEMGQEHD